MVLQRTPKAALAGMFFITVLHAEEKVDFAREVLPILSDKCFACHGPDTRKAKDLRLDSYEAATRNRKGIRSIDPDNLEDSELIFRIHDEDDPMPPEDDGKALTEAEKDILTRWVKQGGEYASHWAFVPPIKRSDAPKNEVIDFYIEKGLKAHKPPVSFAKEASRDVLARRAALVLTGLPPEPALLEDFLADRSEKAYEQFVDRLLSSPGYGEHQARYWLDAIRYGDTHGLHLDNKRGIYPYRDWVVRAFNENLPIDDFVTWQLAGDLLPNPTITQRIATGYVRMNPTTSEGGAIPAEFQAKNNFDRTETLGTVMFGMTMSCARCHTHKYDPITHREYFSLLAFFNSTAESPLDGNKYDHGPAMKAPANPKEWEALASLNGHEEEAMESFTTTTLIARELQKPRVTRVLKRGEYHSPIGEALQPDVPAVMGSFPEDAPRNRLGLARWLTADKHPLVTRVLANRMWQRIFGYGLVRTPEDFGLQGEQATHPELLDWLAVEFREKGWDLKHILRLMVTSQTFKQSSRFRPDLEDPKNLLYARGPSFRLDAEVIRDIGLWSSGLLDPTMGGEGVKPYQPAGLWKALMHPASNTKDYVRDKGERLYRRSLYVYWKRTSPHPMMTLFDAPNRESSCVKRSRTSTALQSLALLNETQRIEMARKLAERLVKSSPDDKARLDLLYKLLACRQALPREGKACLALLDTMNNRYAAAPEEAQALLTTGDSPANPDLNPVELAAWTQVITTVLASDIALSLF
ncbi:PSD1 and planctomycete cytochrome C domain-containing protein [bacterium]|nr:PSD1 and planctomycete cytochrome C domain-containing protein [Akkermansiaceae bacterium]MDB4382925.1 PSD1 and planctomycete cytochrome C domain-containing protein [Akkermansiaceae bacterium]MDB4488428.1 PSD1 and planctomycete cytochrome C domain-containing protein [bacterium]